MNRKRDASVELMRIIACLIVLANHMALSPTVDGHFDLSRTFVACLFSDGVATFFFITGFFLFGNKTYAGVLRHSVRRILVPLLVSVLVYEFLDPVATDLSVGLWASIRQGAAGLLEFPSSLLRWDNPVASFAGHLWYLFLYMFSMLFFPAANELVKALDNDAKAERLFLIVTAMLLVWNDCMRNQVLEFSSHALRGVVAAYIFMIWGHIAYRHRDKLTNPRNIVLAPIAFVAINALRAVVELQYAAMFDGNNHVMYWWTAMGVACTLCIMAFSLSLASVIASDGARGVVVRLAQSTFAVYLMHLLVRKLVIKLPLYKSLRAFAEQPGTPIRPLLYACASAALLFVVCFLLYTVYSCVRRAIVGARKMVANG